MGALADGVVEWKQRTMMVEPRGNCPPDDHFVVALIGALEGLGSNMSVKR